MNLTNADVNKDYVIKEIRSDDSDLKNFLFTLGCYEHEEITVISKLAGNYIIKVKGSRYSIDEDLAKIIMI